MMLPSPPTDQELAGDSLHQFVTHHATVHHFNTGVTRNLAHWLGGKDSICPLTLGLDPGQDAFVTARLRALAAYVGAPVQSDPQCKFNVQIHFTNNPQERMDDVFKWATVYFRNRYSGGMRDLIKFTSDHAIQGWYMTTGGGAINTDVGTICDYLAMLTLSVAQSPDHCDPLPSILDLMSSSCGTRERPTAITAGDLAFLKALYYRNSGSSPSSDEIQDNMMLQFKRP